MAVRLSVFQTAPDSRAAALLHDAQEYLGRDAPSEVRVGTSYVIDAPLTKTELTRLTDVFARSGFEKVYVDTVPPFASRGWILELGFLPGVTDNVGHTAQATIEDALGKKLPNNPAVFSSRLLILAGTTKEERLADWASTLHNSLIERATLYPLSAHKRGVPAVVPRVTVDFAPQADEVNLWVGDEELAQIGSLGIQDANGSRRGPLALSLDAMKVIRTHFHSLGRNPTDIELESLAQTWSEHCKHSIFADPIDEIQEGIYKRYIKGATQLIRKQKGKRDFCISVFTDNAGAVEFDREYMITHKVETHNSPSALDPFGGAITGIVGVNRDALGFGMGAKPIANVYGFCTGDPNDTRPLYRDGKKTRPLLSPERILKGVVAGVNEGGNQSGIPTPQGFVQIDDRYRGKPLVFAGTVGFLPKKNDGQLLHEKAAQAGDVIVVAGGRVGLDGIHGATFSSVALDSGSPATAVQIGDPITQKKMSDAIVKELRDKGWYSSITDNGAGGISCSVAEMARECGGFTVELEKVPLKYPGLSPWQIWISESQERMTLSVPKKHWPKVQTLFEKRGVEATAIGEFNDSGQCVVTYNDDIVLDLAMEFLHDGRPIAFQETRAWQPTVVPAPKLKGRDLKKDILTVLKHPNVGSFAWISQQYDHEVQANSVVKPLVGKGQINTDASVIRPRLDSKRGAVLSHALYPEYSELDSYQAAAAAIDATVRQIVVMGGTLSHLSILDNFCWCSSGEPERLWQLKEAARACYDTALAYGAPFISGKDSMFNDFKGFDAKGKPVKISVPPTLLISGMSVIENVERVVTPDFKFAGDLVYLIGATKNELAGSTYLSAVHGLEHILPQGSQVPRVALEDNKKVYQKLETVIQGGLVASSQSVGRGGLAIALLKSAVGGQWGVEVTLPKGDAISQLFSESQGRILVSIAPKNQKAFEAAVKGVVCQKLGTVSETDAIKIGATKLTLKEATNAYRNFFKDF